MRSLYYIAPFLLLSLVVACDQTEPQRVYKDYNIDLTIEILVDAVNHEPESLKREKIAGEISRVCRNGGAPYIGREGINAIASLLEDDDDSVIASAAASLARIGAPAKYTIHLLQRALAIEQEKHPERKTQSFLIGWDLEIDLSAAIEKLSK